MVYLQNSGIGNTVNPVASLLNEAVYAIPALFVVGWRGEPGVKDEPQHVFQGEITLPLMECLDIKTVVLSKETTDEEFDTALAAFILEFSEGRSAAFVVRKGALEAGETCAYANDYPMTRESIVNAIIDATVGDDVIVSTTGKLSRELFEAREARGQGHGADFLTVGSMGHSSMIGLGVALEKPERRVWVLDGDGAVLMHAGSLAVLGATKPKNLVHVVVNNEAHESVGGMPTVAGSIDLVGMARSFGYVQVFSAKDEAELDRVLEQLGSLGGAGPVFVEVKASIGARDDLGRPTTTPQENKQAFMRHVAGEGGGDSD